MDYEFILFTKRFIGSISNKKHAKLLLRGGSSKENNN